MRRNIGVGLVNLRICSSLCAGVYGANNPWLHSSKKHDGRQYADGYYMGLAFLSAITKFSMVFNGKLAVLNTISCLMWALSFCLAVSG